MALAAALSGLACGGSEASADAASDGKAAPDGKAADQAAAKIAAIDPCGLVTKDEIQAAIEGKRSPDELSRLKSRGITWSISTTPVTEGEERRCQIHWQGNFGSVMQEQSDMAVTVSKAEYFNSNVADLNRVRRRNGKPDLAPIPGVGDEAHYFGYSEKGNPEARVGDVAVGIESLAGKPSLDLLRAAVSRVH
jgi:hypothetical protein